MTIKIKVEGLKELGNMLSNLPNRVENKVLQRSTSKAMRLVLPEFKAAAPKGQEPRSKASEQYKPLEKNLRVATKRQRKKGQRGAVIDTKDAFWGYFLEFGTRFISARPWFVPTFQRVKEKVLTDFSVTLGAGIEDEAKKLL